MKTALLKNGIKIAYDRVVKVESNNGDEKITLYQFTRGNLGIVAVVPHERIERVEA